MASAELIGEIVYGLKRCPQCGVAKPLITKLDKAHHHHTEIQHYGNEYWYFTAECSHCDHNILFYGRKGKGGGRHESDIDQLSIVRTFPQLEEVAEELPPMALKFFQQAVESKHAPDGAVMLAASSIDSMLKDKGYKDGSLYSRIEKASADGLFTRDLADWAHEIRLSANEPRHADENFSGFSDDDAEQIIALAKALGEYLYVLPARVARWKAKAENENP